MEGSLPVQRRMTHGLARCLVSLVAVKNRLPELGSGARRIVKGAAFGLFATALGFGASLTPALAQSRPSEALIDAGAYLAAREADFANDFAALIPYLERLLAVDPSDLTTRERLVVALLALGETPRAARVAEPLFEAAPGNPAALLALLAQAFAAEDYARVIELVGALPNPAPLETLALAWAHLGLGRMSEAEAVLGRVSAQAGMAPFALYCKALMLALVGDVEGALALFEQESAGFRDALNRRGVMAYVELLGLAARFDEALARLADAFPTSDPQVERLRRAYAARESVEFDVIRTPADGMAEVFFAMAEAMRGPDQRRDALLYAQAALAINPKLAEARIVVGEIFHVLKHYDLAAKAFAEVTPEDGLWLAASVGLASTLEAQGKLDEAIETLRQAEQVAAGNPGLLQVLGDLFRRAGRHAEAAQAYTEAIEQSRARGLTIDWQLWFARGVAFERQSQWPKAEADFRRALEIDPDQPLVLNYLGYSLVERREKLDEALALIERAVAGAPDSGFIIDSLAWALFRLGRYEEALPHMERAVELLPDDPILNDHLGDLYWALGRKREARFQWRRALSFGPHEDLDLERVRRKLEVGLDQVLREEGALPLHRPEQPGAGTR